MYKHFYGLKLKPFQLVPNPAFLYKSGRHLKALTYLEYGIKERVGFILLTGEVGSGKTTLIQYLLSRMGPRFDAAVIFNTHVNADELLAMIMSEFELVATGDRASDFETLNLFLIDCYQSRKQAFLIIDEAQNLSSEALEEVRMLSNLHSESHSLLQIMLVGQPELMNKLTQPAMRQFTQRIAVNYHLTGISREETAKYIAHRLKKAGGNPELFTPAAADLIFEMSGGIPRVINLASQAALVYGFADQAQMIGQDIIRQIKRDNLGIGFEQPNGRQKPYPPPPQPPPGVGQEAAVGVHNGFQQRFEMMENSLKNLQDLMQANMALIDKRLKASQNGAMAQLHETINKERAKNLKLTQDYAQLEVKYLALFKFIKNAMKTKSAISKEGKS